MKKILKLILVLISSTVFSQNFNYQAVVSDASGNPITDQIISVKFILLKGGNTGVNVYEESHTTTTSSRGVVSLEVGNGNIISGNFSTIDWSTLDYWMEVSLDETGGTNYSILGASKLNHVPYASFANAVQEPIYQANTFYPELGGYVIDITDNGKHGVVVAMQDQFPSDYGDIFSCKADVANPSRHDIYGKEFRDWRIPNRREMHLIYAQKDQLGTFWFGFFWTSDQVSVDSYWAYNMQGGVPLTFNSLWSDARNVRAVRTF